MCIHCTVPTKNLILKVFFSADSHDFSVLVLNYLTALYMFWYTRRHHYSLLIGLIMKKTAVALSQNLSFEKATVLSMGYWYSITSQGVGLYE